MAHQTSILLPRFSIDDGCRAYKLGLIDGMHRTDLGSFGRPAIFLSGFFTRTTESYLSRLKNVSPIGFSNRENICFEIDQSPVFQMITERSSDCDAKNLPTGSHVRPLTNP